MAEIAILVIDPMGNRFAQLVDDRAPVRSLIQLLVPRLGLPDELSYRLIPDRAPRGLPVDRSLRASGVGPGARLHLVPARDSAFEAALDRLYREARDHVRDQLWDLARRKLELLFRTDPDYPDPAGLANVVPGVAAPVAAAPAPAGAAATPAAGGSGAGCVLALVLAGAGVVAYAHRGEVERWWDRNQPGRANQGGKAATPAQATDPYGVFVGGGYDEVIVGRLSVIVDAPTPQLVGWGLDGTKKVRDTGAQFRMVLGPFATAEEARRAYEADLIPGTQRELPLARGTVARFRFDGKEHHVDNALRFNR